MHEYTQVFTLKVDIANFANSEFEGRVINFSCIKEHMQRMLGYGEVMGINLISEGPIYRTKNELLDR